MILADSPRLQKWNHLPLLWHVKGQLQRPANQPAPAAVSCFVPSGMVAPLGDLAWASCSSVTLAQAPLRHVGHMLGREELAADGGFQNQARSKAEAKYLI